MMENTKFSRYVMYKDIEKWVKTMGPGEGEGLVLGGGSKLTKLWPAMKWTITNYPEVDAMQLSYPDNKWDVVLSDQMLEHVKKPWVAAEEMCRVLKPGGMLICTTCFMQRWHPPKVYFTFHTDGLLALFEEKLKKIHCNGWGNRDANDMFNHNPHEKMWRSMRVQGNKLLEDLVNENDFQAPFATWILGIK